MCFIVTYSESNFVDRVSERMDIGMSKNSLKMKNIQHDQEIYQLSDFMRNSKHIKEKWFDENEASFDILNLLVPSYLV